MGRAGVKEEKKGETAARDGERGRRRNNREGKGKQTVVIGDKKKIDAKSH